MVEFLVYHNIPFTGLATISDKLSRMKVKERTRAIALMFGLGTGNVIAVSGVTGDGKDALLARIGQICTAPVQNAEEEDAAQTNV